MPIADRASAQRGAPLPKVRVAMPRRHVIGVDDGACRHMLDVALDAGLSLLHHASRFLEVHLCLRISTRHDAVAVVLAGAVRAMQPARDAAERIMRLWLRCFQRETREMPTRNLYISSGTASSEASK